VPLPIYQEISLSQFAFWQIYAGDPVRFVTAATTALLLPYPSDILIAPLATPNSVRTLD